MTDTALARGSSSEQNGLAVREEFSAELQTAAASAEKQHEIQSAIVLARRFPRDEDQAFAKLMKACQRTSFADSAEYSFPRGKKKDERGQWVQNYVKGPSVNVAREAARVWGNIRYGIDVIRDDQESRSIRGWAWDLETNVKVQADDDFKKLTFKKGWDNKPDAWVPVDERELRELTNRRGAILVRNCILQILPKDLIEDSLEQAHKTLTDRASKDPEGEKKRIILAFGELSITPEMLAQYLQHPLAQSSPTEIADLRGIYKSIKDGHSTWGEYMNPTKDEAPPAGPAVITEEQRVALVNAAKATGQDLSAIVTTIGFEMLADITVDKFEEVLAAANTPVQKAEEPAKTETPATEAETEEPAPAEEVDPLDSLRANVRAALDDLPATKRKNLIAGKPMIGEMTEEELRQMLADATA